MNKFRETESEKEPETQRSMQSPRPERATEPYGFGSNEMEDLLQAAGIDKSTIPTGYGQQKPRTPRQYAIIAPVEERVHQRATAPTILAVPTGMETSVKALVEKFRRYLERGLENLPPEERNEAIQCKTAIQAHLDKIKK